MTKKELVKIIETVVEKTVGKIVENAVQKLDKEITKMVISVSEVIIRKKLSSLIEQRVNNAVKKEMVNIVKELSLQPQRQIIPENTGADAQELEGSEFIRSVMQEEGLEGEFEKPISNKKVFNQEGGFWDVLNDTANNHVSGQMDEKAQMAAMSGQPLNEDFKFTTNNMAELANRRTPIPATPAQIAEEQQALPDAEAIVQNPATGHSIDLRTVNPNVIKNLTKDYSAVLKAAEEKAKFQRG